MTDSDPQLIRHATIDDLDALAAIAVSDIAELPMSRVSETLSHFTGAHRRFDLTSVTDGVRIYQDYAHNPAEMKTAIHIAAMQPQRVVYVSCDPATLARDVKLLTEKGYTLRSAEAVDLFPKCAHIETVVLLSKFQDNLNQSCPSTFADQR